MKKILIAGGTGLIGKRLATLLTKKGYQVSLLSRNENLNAANPVYGWDLHKMYINPKALENVYGVINLTGAGIADKRWTTQRKKEIIDSRVNSNQLLAQAIELATHKPQVFVACSATGFYGDKGSEIQVETSPVGNDFMAEVCQKWEESVLPIRQMGIRTPVIRVGVVLSSQGGALIELNKTAPLRVMGYFGLGGRYLSWVHIDDICRIFEAALAEEKMIGIYNGAAPLPVTSKQMAEAIVKASGKLMLKTPVPPLMLKIILGEMAAVVLNSTRAIPQNLQDLNFTFEHTDLAAAIKDLFEQKI